MGDEVIGEPTEYDLQVGDRVRVEGSPMRAGSKRRWTTTCTW